MIILLVLLYLLVGLLVLRRLTKGKDKIYPITGVILVVLIWPIAVYWYIEALVKYLKGEL